MAAKSFYDLLIQEYSKNGYTEQQDKRYIRTDFPRPGDRIEAKAIMVHETIQIHEVIFRPMGPNIRNQTTHSCYVGISIMPEFDPETDETKCRFCITGNGADRTVSVTEALQLCLGDHHEGRIPADQPPPADLAHAILHEHLKPHFLPQAPEYAWTYRPYDDTFYVNARLYQEGGTITLKEEKMRPRRTEAPQTTTWIPRFDENGIFVCRIARYLRNGSLQIVDETDVARIKTDVKAFMGTFISN